MEGSYKLNNFTEDNDSEVKRLRSQVELFFKKESEIYTQIGLKDGMNVIECGCGPGYLLLNLAAKFPNSTFTGLEIDSYLYKVFQKNISETNNPNISVKQGSIYDTGEIAENYDVAITRLVIEHLNKPLNAIAELMRILKPHGKLIIISNDFEYHVLTYPYIPELDTMYKAYCKSRVDEGGNPYVGRELPNLLRKFGFSNINLNVVSAHSTVVGDQILLKAENVNISRSLVKNGYLAQDTLDSLTNKWFEMLQDPNHVIYRQLFIVSGEKSSEKIPEAGNITISETQSISKPLNKFELTNYIIQNLVKSFDDESLNIDPNVKLSEYYIDSLIATDIANLIKTEFKTNIKLSDILRNYCVNDLVKQILEKNTSNTDNKEESEQSTWTEGEL